MKRSRLFQKILSVVLVLSLLASVAIPVSAADGSVQFEKIDNSNVTGSALQNALDPAAEEEKYADTDQVRVSVFLEKDSTISAGYEIAGIAENADAMAYRARVLQEQKAVTAAIEAALGEPLDVVWNLTLAANLISANVAYGRIDEIRQVPGVRDVLIENVYYPDFHSVGGEIKPNTLPSTIMTGSAYAWQSGYYGAGSRIAIVDTGIDDEHLSFDPGAFEYGLEELALRKGMSREAYLESLNLLDEQEVADKASLLNAAKGALVAKDAYKNSKIAFGYDYAAGNYVSNHMSLGFDGAMHGSHVAGISAGNAIVLKDGEYVDALSTVQAVGMAPCAQLMAMKVFEPSGGTHESEYMAAIEDAIILGADAVNLSLGSNAVGFTAAQEAYQQIMDNLVGCGAVICISAGNAGHWADTTTPGGLYPDNPAATMTGGAPGTYTNSMCVASVDNIGTTQFLLKSGELNLTSYVDGKVDDPSAPQNSPIHTIPGDYDYVMIEGPGTQEEWTALQDVLPGKIAICARGALAFAEKANFAVDNGAVATIIYNNESGLIQANLQGYRHTAPAGTMTLEEAQKLFQTSTPVIDDAGNVRYYTGKLSVPSAKETVITRPEYFTMSSFSSWGVPGTLEMKPEITAPGGGIHSAFGQTSNAGGHDQYDLMSGTSMAAPQVAGMTALLMEYIRTNDLVNKTGRSARFLAQSLLMSTALPMWDQDYQLYPVIQQGAGLANVQLATQAKTYISMEPDATDSWNDGKVKAELGDDPTRSGSYTFGFAVNNLTDLPQNVTLRADFFIQPVDETTGLISKQTTTLPVQADWGDLDAANVVVPAGGSVPVTVTITIPADAKQQLDLEFPNGTFIQGYVMVGGPTPVSAESVPSVHTIPCLGYYGSWQEPSMFDVGTYQEYDTGAETRAPYLGNTQTNTFTVTYASMPGNVFPLGGNPLVPDAEYLPQRNAINSENGDAIEGVQYALIRNAETSVLGVMNLTQGIIPVNPVTIPESIAAFYDPSASAWKQAELSAPLNYVPSDANEGDVLAVFLAAMPEGVMDQAQVQGYPGVEQILGLGDGLVLQTAVTVDNTAPQLQDVTVSLMNHDKLTVKAADNQYVAGVILWDRSGTMALDVTGADLEAQPGEASEFALDLTGLVDRQFMVQVIDYAGNTTTYAVNLDGEPENYVPQILAFDPEQEAWNGYQQNAESGELFSYYTYSIQDYLAATAVEDYVFAAGADGNLYVMPIDDLTEIHLAGSLQGVQLLDMAYNKANGKIYGVDGTNIYTVDKLTAKIELVEPLPVRSNTLAIDAEGRFYCNEYGSGDVYTFTLNGASQEYLKYDFNNDGTLSSADAEALLAYAAHGVDAVSNPENADLDADGAITSHDAYELLVMLNSGKINGIRRIAAVTVNDESVESKNLQTMEFDLNTNVLYWIAIQENSANLVRIAPNGDYTVFEQPVNPMTAMVIPEKDPAHWADPTTKVEALTLDKNQVTLLANNSVQLNALVLPWTLTDQSVTWTSSDPEIASVTTGGLVFGKNVGTAAITAASVLNPEMKAECVVNVERLDMNVSGVLMDGDSLPRFYDWNLKDSAWTPGNELDADFITAAQDLFDGSYYTIDFDLATHHLDASGKTLATGVGMPYSSIVWSQMLSGEGEPAAFGVGETILGIELDAMNMDLSLALDFAQIPQLAAMLGGFQAVTSLGAMEIPAEQGGGLEEDLLILDRSGSMLFLPVLVTANGLDFGSLAMIPTDLNLAFPGLQGLSLSSMTVGEDGALYLSAFDGKKTDVYRLILDEEAGFLSSYVDSFGNEIWPAMILSAASNKPANLANVKNAATMTVELPKQILGKHSEALDHYTMFRLPAADAQEDPAAKALQEAAEQQKDVMVLADQQLVVVNLFGRNGQNQDIFSTNGLFSVGYDADVLTPVDISTSSELMAVGEKDGKLYAAYAGTDPVPAGTCAVQLLFSYENSAETCVALENLEVNDQKLKLSAQYPLFRENCPSAKFTDVPPCSWMHEGIDFMISEGLMVGTSETTFDPEGNMTRAQMITILYRMEGEPEVNGELNFSDVKQNAASSWYWDALIWATQNGISKGFDDGTFRPDAPVSREDFACFLYRYNDFGGEDLEDALSGFTDRSRIHDYAVEAMNWAVTNGYLQGYQNTLTPRATTTRGQCATVFYRYCMNSIS